MESVAHVTDVIFIERVTVLTIHLVCIPKWSRGHWCDQFIVKGVPKRLEGGVALRSERVWLN